MYSYLVTYTTHCCAQDWTTLQNRILSIHRRTNTGHERGAQHIRKLTPASSHTPKNTKNVRKGAKSASRNEMVRKNRLHFHVAHRHMPQRVSRRSLGLLRSAFECTQNNTLFSRHKKNIFKEHMTKKMNMKSPVPIYIMERPMTQDSASGHRHQAEIVENDR